MKNGLMRRGPFSFISVVVSAMLLRPPMPEPTSTPARYFSSSVLSSRPESFIACLAAAMA